MRSLVRAAVLLLALGALAILSPAATRASTTTVPIGANGIYGPFWYCDSAHSGVVCTTTITVGDSVTWQNNTIIAHTSTECDGVCGTIPGSPIWDSGLIPASGSYTQQFNVVGTFNYQCDVHPTEMKGQIIVLASGPTATPSPTALPPTPTFTPAPVGGVSIDPALRSGSGASSHLGIELLAGATAFAMTVATAAWARRRWLSRST
jgi:hypothetical protein